MNKEQRHFKGVIKNRKRRRKYEERNKVERLVKSRVNSQLKREFRFEKKENAKKNTVIEQNRLVRLRRNKV